MNLESTLNLERVSVLKDNIVHLERSKDQIIIMWTSVIEVNQILSAHDVDIEYFQVTYAHPVLEYFIGVVKGEQQIGNCPVIAKLLEYLKEKHITSSELFMICINFRKAIIRQMFIENLMSEELYESISYVFDANFKGVLEIFNDSIFTVKEESKRLYELSIRDHLTKLFNRKMFDELFAIEIKNAKRSQSKFSLILLDIDHFKVINDTYGHKIGDEILIKLSKLIQQTLRDSDIFARWGGEEFIILMPESNKDNSYQKAEQIRQVIENHQFDTIKDLTCSFGVAQYKEGDDEKSLFSVTDEALYLSKSSGRNRVSVH